RVLEAGRDVGVGLDVWEMYRRYYLDSAGLPPAEDTALRRVLANDAIEQIVAGELRLEHLTLGTPYTFRLITVPLRALEDAALEALSRQGQLSLSVPEMPAIHPHL